MRANTRLARRILPQCSWKGGPSGIDIGGTGIKGAVVDLADGRLVSDRIREKTPQPATPTAVVEVTARVCERLTEGGWLTPDMKAGAGFPAVIKDGRSLSAANVDPGFIDAPVQQLLTERLGRPVVVINDADAAGLAEMAFGAGRGHPGVVLLLTIGTGIGSALLIDEQAGAEPGAGAPPAARPGRRATGERRGARTTPTWAGNAGPASSTSTWPWSSATSRRT